MFNFLQFPLFNFNRKVFIRQFPCKCPYNFHKLFFPSLCWPPSMRHHAMWPINYCHHPDHCHLHLVHLISNPPSQRWHLPNHCHLHHNDLISLICLFKDGTASLGKRRHHRKPEQRLRRGEQLPPDASVFLRWSTHVVVVVTILTSSFLLLLLWLMHDQTPTYT